MSRNHRLNPLWKKTKITTTHRNVVVQCHRIERNIKHISGFSFSCFLLRVTARRTSPPLTVRCVDPGSHCTKMADEDEVEIRGVKRPLVENYSDDEEEEEARRKEG